MSSSDLHADREASVLRMLAASRPALAM